MNVFASLAAVLICFILVVGIHEAGHALAANLFGVKIQKISIGFGKPLIQWTDSKKREWIWAIWPLGGYVQLSNSRIAPVSLSEMEHSFDQQRIWKRIFILLAGSASNFIIAAMGFLIIHLMGYEKIPPIIAEVQNASIAQQAGLKTGDRFLTIGKKTVASWREAAMSFIIYLDQNDVPIQFKTPLNEEKTGKINLKKIRFSIEKNSLLNGLGIKPKIGKVQVEGVGISAAAQLSIKMMIDNLTYFLMSLKQLILGIIPFSVLIGPLGLFSEIIHSFQQGFIVFIEFISTFSLAVGLINLFPLPGLDGGSIVYAIIEKLRGKPLSVALEILLFRLTFIAFCLLLVQLLLNDLNRFILQNYTRTALAQHQMSTS